nr:MAG TPA: Fibrillin 1 unique N-terminal domain [Caudoviricetes sp.]
MERLLAALVPVEMAALLLKCPHYRIIRCCCQVQYTEVCCHGWRVSPRGVGSVPLLLCN